MVAGQWILDVLYPPKCAFCGALLDRREEGICHSCRTGLPWTNGTDVKADFIRSISAPLYYEDSVRRALLHYQFHNARARGRVFGWLVATELQKKDALDFDVVTWVPLSRKREHRRGYDQARIIAEAAAKNLGREAVGLLRKIRDVPAQSGLMTAEARRANISGCYEVIDPNLIAGKRVLIIDDIVTTGSTLSECARMLLLSGAEEVCAAAVACRREKPVRKETIT